MSTQSKGPTAFLKLRKALSHGRAHAQSSEFQSALEYTEPAMVLFPKHVELRLLHAECLGRLGRRAEALMLLDEVLAERPKHEEATALRAAFSEASTEDIAVLGEDDIVTSDSAAVTGDQSAYVPVVGQMSFDDGDDTALYDSPLNTVAPGPKIPRPAMSWDDDEVTSGSFDSLSNDVLERAAEVARELGYGGGVGETREIGTDSLDELDADLLVEEDEEDDIATRVRDRPSLAMLEAMKAQASESTQAARPSSKSGKRPEPQNDRAVLPRGRSIPRAQAVEIPEGYEESLQPIHTEPEPEPQMVIGNAAVDDEDPTTNLGQLEAAQQIEAARLYAQAQSTKAEGASSAKKKKKGGGGGRAAQIKRSPTMNVLEAVPASGLDGLMARLDRRKLARVVLISGGVTLLLLLLGWLPWAWEERLQASIDTQLEEARAACRAGTLQGCERGASSLDGVEQLSGSRIDAIGGFFSWWVEDLFGDQALARSRANARAEAAFIQTVIAREFEPETLPTARDAVGSLSDTSLMSAFLARALLEVEDGQIEAARARFDTFLTLGPGYAPLYYTRGVVDNASGDVERARSSLQRALELDPDFQLARVELAEMLSADEPTAARELLRVVLSKEGADHPGANIALLALDLREGRDVISQVRRIAEGALAEYGRVQRARAYALLAANAGRQGQEGAREAHLRAAVELDPEAFDMRLDHLEVLIRQGRMQEAEKELKALSSLSAQHPLVRVAQAEFMMASRGLADAGLTTLESLRSETGRAAWVLGRTAIFSRDDEAARVYFLEAAERLPAGERRLIAKLVAETLSADAPKGAVFQLRSRILAGSSYEISLVSAFALLRVPEERASARNLFDAIAQRYDDDALARAAHCVSDAVGGSEAGLSGCERALATAPDNFIIELLVAEAFRHLGRVDEAKRHFAAAVELYPGMGPLGSAIEEALRRNDAVSVRAFIKRWPSDAQSHPRLTFYRGRLALLEGKNDEAVKAFESIQEDGNEARTLALAQALLEEGRIRDARRKAESLLSTTSPELALLRARLAMEEERFDKALNLARVAERTYVDVKDARGIARAKAGQALVELRRKSDDAARDLVQEALDKDPNCVEALLLRAQLAERSGDKEKARVAIDAVLERIPDQRQALTIRKRL